MSQDQDTFTNADDTKLPEENGVVQPFGWRIIIMPMRPPEKSKGGIILTKETQAKTFWMGYVGRIVAVGPAAYKARKFRDMAFTDEMTPKRGEWWLYTPYQPYRIKHGEVRLIAVNDDSLIARVPDGVSPWAFELEG